MLTNWIRRFRSADAEMRAEMEFHKQARAADLERHHGMSRDAARRQAAVEFGSVEARCEDGRQALGYQILDEARGDLRYAARGLRRSPGFACAAVLILALAIGINAAFFTLYSNYALRPIPIRSVDRHVEIAALDAHGAPASRWSPEEIVALREAGREEFEGIYSASGLLQILLLAPVQRHSMVAAVSANYFPLLGATVQAGRTLFDQEERQPVAVLSDSGWKRLFPASQEPIGETVRIGSTLFTIVGVTAPSFTGTEAAVPDIWVGVGMRNALREGIGLRQPAAGLLRPGVAPERAEQVLAAAASRFDRPTDERVAAVDVTHRTSYIGTDGPETTLIAGLLFATFLLVLLIACANLANLFLARMAARKYEISMRFALGAARSRIVRQLLTETTLLALAGAGAGLAVAVVFIARAHEWLLSMASGAGAAVLPVAIDWRVAAYSLFLGVLSGCGLGLLPALDSTARVRRSSARLRRVLLSGQVACSFVLLILSGLLVRNLQRLDATEVGYDLDRAFDLQMEPPAAQALERLRSHPGVLGVSAVSRVPLYGRLDRTSAEANGNLHRVSINYVDEHYFETIGLPFTDGRGFRKGDASAAVLSESASRRLFGAQGGTGQLLRIGEASAVTTYQVVGTVPDVVSGWMFEGPDAAVYVQASAGDPRVGSAIIRLADTSPAAVMALRELCATTPGAPGCDPKPLRDVAAMQRFPFDAAARIGAMLGAAALLLSALGLYSVVSYSMEQRRLEIGILMAIGARPVQVTRRMLQDTASCLLGGLAAGLPVCLALSAAARATVSRIDAFDPVAYLGVAGLLLAVGATACLLPVRRALRVQPVAALRHD